MITVLIVLITLGGCGLTVLLDPRITRRALAKRHRAEVYARTGRGSQR